MSETKPTEREALKALVEALGVYDSYEPSVGRELAAAREVIARGEPEVVAWWCDPCGALVDDDCQFNDHQPRRPLRYADE